MLALWLGNLPNTEDFRARTGKEWRLCYAFGTKESIIAAINRDSNSEFRVTEAVAYGDFLLGPEHCQAADVGIELTRLRASARKGNSNDFLQHLGGKSLFLNIQPYQKWMSDRAHRRLLINTSQQETTSLQPENRQ